MTSFKDYWELIEQTQRPQRARKIIRRDWDGFEERVLRGDDHFVRSIVDSLYQGDCYILSGAFKKSFMEELKLKAMKFFRSEPSSFHKMKEGTPDFHKIITEEEGKKYSFKLCKHAAYYFPWNHDPIWEPVWKKWRVLKVLMGLQENEYEQNTPKDGVVDRIQIVQYPPQLGFIEPHADPFLYQRLFISAYLSKRGVDYQGGGFYLVGRDDKELDTEPAIEVGDIGIGYATVCHGVNPCDLDLEPDWDTASGRWFLGLYSNASDEVQDRHTGHAVKL
jgi:hypothetical protein